MARSGRRVTRALDELLTTDWYEYDRNLRYWYEYTAYALVHFLIHGESGWHQSRFPRFLRALREGSATAEALALAYPDVLDDEWDERLSAHVRPRMGPARLAAMPELVQGNCMPVPAAAHAAEKPRRLATQPAEIETLLEDLERVDVFRRHAAWFPRDIVEAEAAKRPRRGRTRPVGPPGDELPTEIPTIRAGGR
jgi:hypothetical protein